MPKKLKVATLTSKTSDISISRHFGGFWMVWAHRGQKFQLQQLGPRFAQNGTAEVGCSTSSTFDQSQGEPKRVTMMSSAIPSELCCYGF